LDYTLPDARQWWGDLHSFYMDQGVAGIWNDMNEPSDFVDQTGGNQRDVVSYDEGQKTTQREESKCVCSVDGPIDLRRTRTTQAR
jgi:alpha-glucosidase